MSILDLNSEVPDQSSLNPSINDLPVLAYEHKNGQFLIKRFIDYLVAIILFIILLPVLAAIAIFIKLESQGSVIFTQSRVGRFNRIFTIYKFRTMAVNSDQGNLEISKSDARITKVGHFLRNSSLDELPQIFNILKGEMSLIGPRPTLPAQVEKYSPRQRLRLQGLPGVTNLPAVSGRNTLDWDDRIELDITYLENWSLGMDLMILWKTIFVVLRQEGVYGLDGVNRSKK